MRSKTIVHWADSIELEISKKLNKSLNKIIIKSKERKIDFPFTNSHHTIQILLKYYELKQFFLNQLF